MSAQIHETALVEKGAELGKNVSIGPYCRISAQTKIGDGTRLDSHVLTEGNVTIGERNTFYPFSLIGGPPQDISYQGEDTSIVIGDDNLFREQVTVHRGTMKDRAVTTIGSHNYFMVATHVAHDCIVGNHIQMANQSALAGHVEVEDYCVVGGQTAVIQKCRLGSYSFLGAGTVIRKDIPPFMAAKEFSSVSGPNLVGLRRKGFANEDIRIIGEMYKLYYLSSSNTQEVLSLLEGKYPDNPHVKHFVDFVRASQVGVQR